MNENRKTPSKGILSFITGPPNIDENFSYALRFMPLNVHAERLRRNRARKNKRSQKGKDDDVEGSGAVLRERPYRPHNAEFTLLFFCDFHCVNTRRFTFILADFLRHAQSQKSDYSDHGTDSYHLVCIPNDDIRGYENGTILSHLQSETDYWHLGFDHTNRLSIIR